MTKLIGIAIGLVVALGACGDKDCEELCEEAQAGDCTSIEGSCSGFCGALDTVEGPGGCADERSAYEGCLNEKANVCDVGCGGEESALESCVSAYCLGHASDPACGTLAGSF